MADEEAAGITVTFNVNAREQVRASRLVMLRTVSMWILFALFVLLPLSQLPFMELGPGEAPWMLWLPLPLAAGGLVFWYLFPWIPVLALRRGMKEPNGPYTVMLDHRGVIYVQPHARLELQWEVLVRARETAEFFLLYTSKACAQLIPKRVVSVAHATAIRALLREKLPGRVSLMMEGAG